MIRKTMMRELVSAFGTCLSFPGIGIGDSCPEKAISQWQPCGITSRRFLGLRDRLVCPSVFGTLASAQG